MSDWKSYSKNTNRGAKLHQKTMQYDHLKNALNSVRENMKEGTCEYCKCLPQRNDYCGKCFIIDTLFKGDKYANAT